MQMLQEGAQSAAEVLCTEGCPMATSPPIKGIYIKGCRVHDAPLEPGLDSASNAGPPVLVQMPHGTVLVAVLEGTSVLSTPPGTTIWMACPSFQPQPNSSSTPLAPPESLDTSHHPHHPNAATPSSPADGNPLRLLSTLLSDAPDRRTAFLNEGEEVALAEEEEDEVLENRACEIAENEELEDSCEEIDAVREVLDAAMDDYYSTMAKHWGDRITRAQHRARERQRQDGHDGY